MGIVIVYGERLGRLTIRSLGSSFWDSLAFRPMVVNFDNETSWRLQRFSLESS